MSLMTKLTDIIFSNLSKDFMSIAVDCDANVLPLEQQVILLVLK